VQHRENLDCIVPRPGRDDIAGSGDREFPCAAPSPGTAHFRKAGQSRDRDENALDLPIRRDRVIATDASANAREFTNRSFGPD
jgi:hypothetical protein